MTNSLNKIHTYLKDIYLILVPSIFMFIAGLAIGIVLFK